MGLFGKIKDKLGIAGVKVDLQIGDLLSSEGGVADGKLVLTSKSDQEIVSILITLKEDTHVNQSSNDSKTFKFILAKMNLEGGFSIKEGETKEIDFKFEYPVLMTVSDKLKSQEVMFKGKSSYTIEADVDVKSAVIDPSAKQKVVIEFEKITV